MYTINHCLTVWNEGVCNTCMHTCHGTMCKAMTMRMGTSVTDNFRVYNYMMQYYTVLILL